MSTHHSNTPLRASQRKLLQRQNLRRQARMRAGLLLIIIIVTAVVDVTFFSNDGGDVNFSPLTITKSVALGAALNWIAQSLFAWFVLRYSGANYRHKIVGQMYIGQIIKWVVVICGFSMIFMTIKSLSAVAVILGFIVMQLCNLLILLKNR